MYEPSSIIVSQSTGSVLMEHRASLNNPKVSLSDPDAWDELFGAGRMSSAGTVVGVDNALSIAAVWQVVSLIANDVAKLPLNVYERQEDESRRVARRHAAQNFVNGEANEEKTSFDFWRDLMVHALLWNNGYAFIDRNGRGEPMGLYNLLPDRTAPVRRGGVKFYETEVTMPNGAHVMKTLAASDVLHVRNLSLDGLAGYPLIEAARDSWGLSLAAQGFASKFFKHGVRTGGILEVPLGTPAAAAGKLTEGFQKFHEGPENWFKTVILRDGAKFHQTSIPPNEGQMNETREQQVREVCRWFGVPPSKLGIADSSSYNSKSEDSKSYLDACLSGWLMSISTQCDAKLLSLVQKQSRTHFFEHNTAALLAMNMKDRYSIYAIAVQRGILCPNEVRQFENLPPRRDGKGDEYVDILAASGGLKGIDGGNQNTGEAVAGNGEGDRGPQGAGDLGATGSRDELATKRLVFAIAARARHKAKNSRAFLEWVDGNLSGFRQDAASTGVDEAIIDRAVDALKRIADTTTASELLTAVDGEMTIFESEESWQTA